MSPSPWLWLLHSFLQGCDSGPQQVVGAWPHQFELKLQRKGSDCSWFCGVTQLMAFATLIREILVLALGSARVADLSE